METKDIQSAIADIHNNLLEISVRGEDVLRMASIIQACRNLVYQISQGANQNDGVASDHNKNINKEGQTR